MKLKFIKLYVFTILNINIFPQAVQLPLLFNWADTTLPSSSMYDNTYNEVWGVVINNNEYAIIGSTMGTHIFNLSNYQQVAFIPGADQGPTIVHRDYHDYKGYLYAVSDEGNSTLQIIDLHYLPDSAPVVYDSNTLFSISHNIFIDSSNALLYVCVPGINWLNRLAAMQIFSLSNPLNPVLLYSYNDVSTVHDLYVKNNIAFLNCGTEGLRIMDFSNPASPVLLDSLLTYPDQDYNHSGWLSPDGKTYLFTDENYGMDIKIYDVSNLQNIQLLNTFNDGISPNSMAHNVMIKDNFAYVSYYHDGLQVFDISNPLNIVKIAYYDTYPDTGYSSVKGAWGVYSLLPSGKILVSDMQYGLFVFDSNIFNSIKQNKNNNYFSVYPNPAFNYIYINSFDVHKNIKITIFDISGKMVFDKVIKNNGDKQIKINIKNFPVGIFYLRINSKDKELFKKLVFSY